MASGESEAALSLLRRILDDPEYRARFRRDPQGAFREAGLESLAQELGTKRPMETLDIRESRSSLAGALMAAAVEGVGAYDFSHHLVDHVDSAQAATPGQ